MKILTITSSGVAALVIGLTALAAPAEAAPQATGSLTLRSSTSARNLQYSTCAAAAAPTAGTYTSFVNQPLSGCAVALVSRAGTFELCIGSGSIPAAFQVSPTVRIRPGVSVPCGVSAG